MTKDGFYRTRELSLATYLISLGLDFVAVEPITENSYWFVFEEPDRCLKFEKKFVETKETLLRALKDYKNKQYG